GDSILHGRNRANLHNGFRGLLEDELLIDPANLGSLFHGLAAACAIFLGRGLGDIVLEMTDAVGVLIVNLERVLVMEEIDLATLGINLMLAVGLVPLGDGRVLVHVLDDFAPADAGVVGAEGNFTLLGGVRNDAHLGAAEIVVEKILEPHAGKEEEVPWVLAAAHGVFESAVRADAAVNLLSDFLSLDA